MNPDVKKHLWPEEWELYLDAYHCIKINLTGASKAKATMAVLENLSACRAIIKENQYDAKGRCIHCGVHRKNNCPSSCAIAAQLKGVGGE